MSYCSDVLPQWLTDQMPEVRQCGFLGYDDMEEIFWIREENEYGHDSLIFFDRLADVEKHCANKKKNVSLDKSIQESFKVLNNNTVKDDGRYFVFRSDTEKVAGLEKVWKEWQKNATDFEKNKKWQNAYKMIELLPLSWKPRYSYSFQWIVNDGHENLKHTLNEERIILDLYVPGYEDVEFTVEEESFEKAYVHLAEQLLNYFRVEDCREKVQH